MRNNKAPLFLRLFFTSVLLASSLALSSGTAFAAAVNKDFPYNPYVPLEVWQSLEPYFLPEKHPARSFIDEMFHSSRITLSTETLKQAGFRDVKQRHSQSAIVTTHPDCPGYFFKFYVDTQKLDNDWWRLVERIYGAEAARECIKRHGFHGLFKVPRKWLYPLPIEPSIPEDERYLRKNFFLVAEDMHVLSQKENRKAYRTRMTKRKLDAFYIILSEEGLNDSTYAENSPFTKDGYIAFIDTERYNKPVTYTKMLKYLSEPMQKYWQKLIDEGGPQSKE